MDTKKPSIIMPIYRATNKAKGYCLITRDKAPNTRERRRAFLFVRWMERWIRAVREYSNKLQTVYVKLNCVKHGVLSFLKTIEVHCPVP